MSKYTTEVRWFCESKYLGKNPENVDEVIQATYPYILKPALMNELFDENYYPIIAKKIIRHYYFREIGAETVGLWIYWMNTRFSELLPYYNKLWQSALLEFDPFNDVDYTREGNKQGLNSEVSNGTSTDRMNGGINETTNESSTEQGKGETAETGKSTDNKSESGRENVNRLTSSVGGSDSSTTDSGEETVSSEGLKNRVSDKDTTEQVNDSRTTAGNTNSSTSDSNTETINHDSTDTKWDLYSDTPQGSISNIDLDTFGSNPNASTSYLTNARKNTDEFEEETNKNGAHNGVTTGETNETSSGNSRTTGSMDETVNESEASNEKTSFGKIVDVVANNNSETTEDISNTNNKIVSGNQEDERNTVATNEKLSNKITDRTHTSDSERVGETTGSKSGNEQEQWFEHIAGKMNTISYSELLEKYRKTFLNIDLMFIKEFDDLFMRLW